jgi:hypothetical protein
MLKNPFTDSAFIIFIEEHSMLHTTIKPAVFVISLLATVSLLSAEPCFEIDSLVGKAEVQRAGMLNWKIVTEGTKLYNNDVFRVLEKSHAKIVSSSGSMIYINEKSQILVNLAENRDQNILSNYITVFFGATFFVIKKMLPKKLTIQTHTKVYTPTAVMSIRGTAFTVDVEKKSGKTAVQVMNGTIVVKNIIRSISSFLSSPYKSTIEVNSDPAHPVPILENDITVLKSWVPEPVVDDIISHQLASRERERHIISGKYENKLIITAFPNASQYQGSWNIGKALAGELARYINSSQQQIKAAVFDSTWTDPLSVGTAKKSRFVITGVIEKFDIIQVASITTSADKYNEYYVAKVKIALQLIDVAEKKLVLEETIDGEVSGKNVKANSWQMIGDMKFKLHDSKFSRSILGQAIHQTIETIVTKTKPYMK